MDEVRAELENVDAAIKTLEHMCRMGKPNENELTEAYITRGMFYWELSKFGEAISDFNQALGIMKHVRDNGKQPDKYYAAMAYMGRGISYYMTEKYNLALPDLTEGIELFESLQRENISIRGGLFLTAYLTGARLNEFAGNIDVAIAYHQKAIRMAERFQIMGEPFDINLLIAAHMCIGGNYDQQEKLEEANRHYGKCIAILEGLSNAGEDIEYGDLADVYMNRGGNYYMVQEIDKALLDFDKCVNIRERLQKEGKEQNEFNLFMAYKNRSQAYEVANNAKAAIQDLITAMQILKGVFSSRPELQEEYYNVLDELITLIKEEDNKTLLQKIKLIKEESNKELLQKILQEFLYPLRSVPKTKEAEAIQNRIIKKVS